MTKDQRRFHLSQEWEGGITATEILEVFADTINQEKEKV